MNYWKRILPVTIAFTLAIQTAAYAEIIIPPAPLGNSAAAGALGPGGSSVIPGTTYGGSMLPGPGTTGNSGTAEVPGEANQPAAGSFNEAGSTELKAPEVASEGAVLMDAATGKVLFGKNQDQQFYPASITKVMTALLVLEHCNLNDTVTFSAEATTNLESGAVSLGISEGDQLTVEQALYGLLLKSANEIGNGLAEHVAGSVSAFADMMNARAKELGCKNTNFVNPHGLNDPNHKTTPYDMALILRAALQYETFRKIDTTLTYEFPAVKNAAARTITMGHKMMYPSDSRYYEGIIGGKTGYTSLAGNTLVTGVERNGVRLIAVVMKSKSTHYQDTKAMLDYGFANYAALTGGATGQSSVSGPNTVSQPSGSGSGTGPSSGAAAGNGTGSSNSTAAGNGTTPGSGTNSGSATGPVNSVTARNGTASGSGTTTGVSAGPGAEADGWHQNDRGWYYVKSGARTVSGWQTVDGLDYCFDSSGYMVTGWYQSANGAWYYLKPSIGYAVKNNWVESSGNWYYLGSDGIMLTNTTTPDGYQVDGNGVWIQ